MELLWQFNSPKSMGRYKIIFPRSSKIVISALANSCRRKTRYNAKTYTQIGVSVRKELAAKFKEKCEKEGVSQASILKKAIEDYVGETE